MKCPIVSINREPQDCIEEKCWFWKDGKCSWISIKKFDKKNCKYGVEKWVYLRRGKNLGKTINHLMVSEMNRGKRTNQHMVLEMSQEKLINHRIVPIKR